MSVPIDERKKAKIMISKQKIIPTTATVATTKMMRSGFNVSFIH